MSFLPEADFKNIVEHTVLVAADLIIYNKKREVLLGLRNNAPAKDFWFVPGGRIFKGERVLDGLSRIAKNELGITLIENSNLNFKGVYEHFYPDSFWPNTDLQTHYLILAYEICLNDDVLSYHADNQHSSLKFFSIKDLLKSENVHQYTKNYFSE